MEVGAMKNAFTPMKEVIMNSFLNTHLGLILAALTCLTCDVYAAPNHAPVANNDAFAVIEDGVLTVTTPGVLANDTDADQDPLIAIVVSQPSHGTLTFDKDGAFTYTPAANFNGTDSFTYEAIDGRA